MLGSKQGENLMQIQNGDPPVLRSVNPVQHGRRHGVRRLILAVLAVCSAALILPQAGWADSAPYANVFNSSGQQVAAFGTAYQGSPGGQIQAAENYAHEHGDTLIRLDSGTFRVESKGKQVGAFCVGVYAYSNIELIGAANSPSTVQADAGGSVCPDGYLDALIFAGANPNNIAEPGSSLNVQNMVLDGNSQATYGLFAGAESGPSLLVQYITTQGSIAAGIVVGYADPNLSTLVSGTSASPALVQYNTIRNAGSDGIVVDGSNIVAQGNTVRNVGQHHTYSNGIGVFTNAENITVQSNTIESSPVGVGLDGTFGTGSHNVAYSNQMVNDCWGIALYRQFDDTIDWNWSHDTSGYSPPSGGCQSTAGNAPRDEVGLMVQDSYNNFAYQNTLSSNGYGFGIFLWNTGNSPIANGTVWNYIGLTWAVYHEWPGPVEGNVINKFSRPVVIADQTHRGADGGNAIWGTNAAESGECYYDNMSQSFGQNKPASCN